MHIPQKYSYADFGVTRFESKTDSGLRVVLYHRKNMPLSMELLFRSGALNDPIGKEGLAHYVEHMIASGTKKFPTKDKLAEYIENTGSSFVFFTNKEAIGIDIELADVVDMPLVIDFLNEIFTESLFLDKTLRNEKKAIYQEIGDKYNSPNKYLHILEHVLYTQGTRLERLSIGTKKSVSTITKEDILNYYKKMFTSNRGVLVASGDIDIKDLVKYFNNLKIKTGQKVKFDNSEIPEYRKKYFSYKKFPGVKQIQFDFGFRTCNNLHPDYYPLLLLNQTLGRGRTSVLLRKLRLDKGLVYSCGSGFGAGFDYGSLGAGASTHINNLQEVIDIVVSEFHRIDSGDFMSEINLKFLKNRIIKSKKRSIQKSSTWTRGHAFGDLFNLDDHETLPLFLDRIDFVKFEDVERVSKTYFKPDTWYFAMVGDVTKKDVKVNY